MNPTLFEDFAQAAALEFQRPTHREDRQATANDPASRAATAAPSSPLFAVADHDTNTWRIYDGTDQTTVTESAVLDCDLHVDRLVVEACHLVPQGDMSVAAPFTLDQLHRFAANAAANGVQIRTVPQRRTPRVWGEIGPYLMGDSYTWESRDKTLDTLAWHHWLAAKPGRLESCKIWTPEIIAANPTITELRNRIMRDVNMVRQWRQYPRSQQAQRFADTLVRTLLGIFSDNERGRGLLELLARLGCEWRPRKAATTALFSPHVRNGYCVARDPITGRARPNLSGRTIRRICGLYANGYPNQIRSDARHHARSLGKPTDFDRDFVTLIRLFG